MSSDYYLKIDEVKGESLTVPGALEISSFSWGAANSGRAASGSGLGAGKTDFHDFSFSMPNNQGSPTLMLSCATGKHIAKAHLECRKAAGNVGKQSTSVYLTVDFEDLLISSYQTGGSTGDMVPQDSISFNFSKVTIEYFTQDAKGITTSAGKTSYDVKKNVGNK